MTLSPARMDVPFRPTHGTTSIEAGVGDRVEPKMAVVARPVSGGGLQGAIPLVASCVGRHCGHGEEGRDG